MEHSEKTPGVSWRELKTIHEPFEKHDRKFETNRYIYPVISRRSRGVSIGVNLNPDKRCNFNCVYCQIDRTQPGSTEPVDLELLQAELEDLVRWTVSGDIFKHPWFEKTPVLYRRFNDIALSGEGEPTLSPVFPEAVEICADVRKRLADDDVKLVLITNATTLHVPKVRDAVRLLHQNNGEIWAKLEAGTEPYYQHVLRSNVPFQQVLDNLKDAACRHPIVIQTLMLRTNDEEPSPREVDAYCDRLNEIVAAGGTIKAIQLHTVARPPAEKWVGALADVRLDAIALRIEARTNLPIEVYYG